MRDTVGFVGKFLYILTLTIILSYMVFIAIIISYDLTKTPLLKEIIDHQDILGFILGFTISYILTIKVKL